MADPKIQFIKKVTVDCRTCEGKGFKKYARFRACPNCGGTGKISFLQQFRKNSDGPA